MPPNSRLNIDQQLNRKPNLVFRIFNIPAFLVAFSIQIQHAEIRCWPSITQVISENQNICTGELVESQPLYRCAHTKPAPTKTALSFSEVA
jgi:hypothetical protein